MQFTVVQLQGTLVIDNDPAVVGMAVRIVLHEREAAPDAVVHARALEGCHLRTIQPAHELRIGVHGEPVQRVLREYD